MIIQFSHNGKEINLSHRCFRNRKAYIFESKNSGYRYWNNENEHKRKFMKYKGLYLENLNDTFSSKPKKSDLFFWGEWEPQSDFELTGNSYCNKKGLPHAIHIPFFSNIRIGKYNTDPFVFGKYFYCTNCKQKQKGKGKKLLNLKQDSVILFGSERNRNEFVLDTVFVVKSSDSVAYYHKHPNHYPTILRQATIDLNGGLAKWHIIYKGKMYNSKKPASLNSINSFCFFPCKINCDKKGFERPIIDWKRFKLQKPGAGTVLHDVNYDSEFKFWYDIVKEVLEQDYALGIKLEMPKHL